MQVQQVFSSYNSRENSVISEYTYCPVCGNTLVVQDTAGRPRAVCPRCPYIHYRNPAPGVVVLIEDNGAVLLGKRGDSSYQAGKWGLPGGFIEFDEDFLTAGHREAKEETGLDIEIRSILSVTTNFFTPNYHSIAVTLLARVAGGTICPGDDLVALQWFPFAGPLPDMAFEADRHIIMRYHHDRPTLTGAPIDPDFARRQVTPR